MRTTNEASLLKIEGRLRSLQERTATKIEVGGAHPFTVKCEGFNSPYKMRHLIHFKPLNIVCHHYKNVYILFDYVFFGDLLVLPYDSDDSAYITNDADEEEYIEEVEIKKDNVIASIVHGSKIKKILWRFGVTGDLFVLPNFLNGWCTGYTARSLKKPASMLIEAKEGRKIFEKKFILWEPEPPQEELEL